MKLRKDRRHLYDSIEEGQLADDGDYIPKDFADWREIPSQALEQKELREALTKALNSFPRNIALCWFCEMYSTSASQRLRKSWGLPKQM